jgi:alpha-methylacyl-CoA racemase
MLDGGAPNYRCYECADGRYVAVGALEPQFWQALVDGLGLVDAPSPYDPGQWAACAETLDAAFKTRSRDEWADLFADTDACVAPVLTLDEAPKHPHNVARRSYAEVGPASLIDSAPRFSETPGRAGELTEIGADTAALLTELGYDDAAVESLRATRTIP